MAKLSVGEKMPNLVFNTAHESNKTVETVIGEKKRTVFALLRFIGCTSCRYDIHLLAGRYQEFLDLDTQVYIVLQSEPANVREDLKNTKLPFDIICDADMEFYQRLDIPVAPCREERMPNDPVGIAKLEERKQKIKEIGFVHGKNEGKSQQLPALFVVEQDGTVSYAHYAKNSVDMPSVNEMLKIIQADS